MKRLINIFGLLLIFSFVFSSAIAQEDVSIKIVKKANSLAGALTGLMEDWGATFVTENIIYIPEYGLIININTMINSSSEEDIDGKELGKEVFSLLRDLGKRLPIDDGKWIVTHIKLAKFSGEAYLIYEWQKGTNRVRYWYNGVLQFDEENYFK